MSDQPAPSAPTGTPSPSKARMRLAVLPPETTTFTSRRQWSSRGVARAAQRAAESNRLAWPAIPPRRLLHACLLVAAVAVLAPAAAQGGERKLYVSLGDSYATGYQVTEPDGRGRATRKGYADLLVKAARTRGHRLRLVNFGCGGETALSILERRTACPGPAAGGPHYAGRTQIRAAERFLRRHRGEVKLITVSIGGNDITRCVTEPDPISCLGAALTDVRTYVGRLVRRLRDAAGRRARIVGLTYPDVILGQWVGEDADPDLAALSAVAFRTLINPALKEQYEAVGGRFVDVTAATGAYGSLEETTTLAPYGVIPKPVARICRLTFYCEFRDIHARTKGYRRMATLIARTLPRRH